MLRSQTFLAFYQKSRKNERMQRRILGQLGSNHSGLRWSVIRSSGEDDVKE
jgi:hypothetical protein